MNFSKLVADNRSGRFFKDKLGQRQKVLLNPALKQAFFMLQQGKMNVDFRTRNIDF